MPLPIKEEDRCFMKMFLLILSVILFLDGRIKGEIIWILDRAVLSGLRNIFLPRFNNLGSNEKLIVGAGFMFSR